MTLRTRLIATSLLVLVPLTAALLVIDDRLRGADQLERLTEFARTELESGAHDRCVATDRLTGRPRPGLGLGGRGRGGAGRTGRPGGPPPGRGEFPPPPPGEMPDSVPAERGPVRPYSAVSYGADFTPASPSVPDLDPAIRAGLATGDFMGAPWSSADGRGYQLGLWMDRTDTGRCAVLLLRMPPRPGEFRERVSAIALIVISVIVATWLAAGPVLRRLRKLATDVHRSADTRYDTPVVVEGQDEVADLAQAFNDAGARVRQHLVDLQRREEHLRQFVANTAHDVGVPLTVLQGHLSELDTCKEEVRSNKSEVEVGSDKDEGGSAGAHVRAAIGEAHYLGSLIRNLNAATRLDAVDMPLVRHDVDLNALVERLAARYRVVARARGVELNEAVPETPVIVSAEVTLLEQALGNLVDNAVRHNRPGGHVAIVLDARHGGFSLTVTDDGPGVAEADLARLTERWFRADEARTRRPDGQGLGLAIAAESLKRLGFTLTFSRPADGGLRAEIAS